MVTAMDPEPDAPTRIRNREPDTPEPIDDPKLLDGMTHSAMLFTWEYRKGRWHWTGFRTHWWANLKAFLWWGPRHPLTGRLLPPGTWTY